MKPYIVKWCSLRLDRNLYKLRMVHFFHQDKMVFNIWFMVDAQPFKQALLNIIKRWSFMFKEHLISHVTTSLNDLQEIIKVTSTGFNVEIEEGDYDGLVGVMGHLLAVRDRQAATGRSHSLTHSPTHPLTHSPTHSPTPLTLFSTQMECLSL